VNDAQLSRNAYFRGKTVSLTLSSSDMFKIELENTDKSSETSAITHEGLNDAFLHLMASKKLCKHHRENSR
jgi:hypothetical protein